MTDYNIASYFNDSFGIDSADAVALSDIDLDSIDNEIDLEITESDRIAAIDERFGKDVFSPAEKFAMEYFYRGEGAS